MSNHLVTQFFTSKAHVGVNDLVRSISLLFFFFLQCVLGVRRACSLNIGDDLSGVLSSAPTIERLCTHGLKLKAADGNRIAKGISPANDMENIACSTCGIICASPARLRTDI